MNYFLRFYTFRSDFGSQKFELSQSSFFPAGLGGLLNPWPTLLRGFIDPAKRLQKSSLTAFMNYFLRFYTFRSDFGSRKFELSQSSFSRLGEAWLLNPSLSGFFLTPTEDFGNHSKTWVINGRLPKSLWGILGLKLVKKASTTWCRWHDTGTSDVVGGTCFRWWVAWLFNGFTFCSE